MNLPAAPRRRLPSVRLALWAFAPAALAACTTTPNILPTNDFNRPTDIAFMCFGAFDSSGSSAANAGTAGTLVVSGQAMRACHPPGAAVDLGGADPGPTASTRTFAFMTDSGSGEISVVDADKWQIVDLDPSVGGYGRAPLGPSAEQISASDDGCRIVSANRGSCDLSLVDPSVLVTRTFNSNYSLNVPVPEPQTYRQTVVPRRADGSPLGAAPYEVAFLPQDTSSAPPSGTNICRADGAQVPTVGFPTSSGAMPWRALVTFPSCDLIAIVNLPSGDIIDSWAFVDDGTGYHDYGASPPACPVVDCTGQLTSPGTSAGVGGAAAGAGGSGGFAGGSGGSAGAAGGASGSPGGAGGSGGMGGGSAGTGGGAAGATGSGLPNGSLRPAGIAIAPPSGPVSGPTDALLVRAYVSFSNWDKVLSVDVSSAGLRAPPPETSSTSTPFIEIKPIGGSGPMGGSDRVRLSVDPYQSYEASSAAPYIAGKFVGRATVPDRRYLYVIGHDGAVHVIWVGGGGLEQECETNADPTQLPAGVPVDSSCLPIGTPRRPFVYWSGIRPPSIPIDVAAADVRPTGNKVSCNTKDPADTCVSELTVSGAFAHVLTATGTVYLVNIDPVARSLTQVIRADPGMPPMPNPASNTYLATPQPEPTQLVNGLRDQNQASYSASADPSSGPARLPILPAASFTTAFIEPFWARGTANNATAVDGNPLQTALYFQDPTGVTAQVWTVSWQGLLIPGRFGGKVSASTNTLSDGAGFCSSGVLAGDLVTFTGCTNDTQCVPNYKCHQDPTATQATGGLQITGLCVPPDLEQSRVNSCPAAFQTLRRYEIQLAHDSSLTLRPHLDELVHSSLTDCRNRNGTSATDGSSGGAGGANGGGSGAGGIGGGGGGATDGGASVGTENDCNDLTDPSTLGFQCMRGPGTYDTGNLRCLKTCETSADCRPGRFCWVWSRSCVNQPDKACGSAQDCDPQDTKSCHTQGYCADAPPLAQIATCLDQLVTYNVAAAGSYLVSGSATGLLVSGRDDANNGCTPLDPIDPRTRIPDPSKGTIDWRNVARIPISDNGLAPGAKACANVHPVPTDAADLVYQPVDSVTGKPVGSPITLAPNDTEWANRFDSRVNPPPLEGTTPNQPLSWLKTDPALRVQENPCLFEGGPNASDSDVKSNRTHIRALFQNTQLSFVLANVDWEPPSLSVQFDVTGGARAQSVLYPPTVEVSSPARIVLGPIDSQVQTTNPLPDFESPYLFVVDQRRLGRAQGGGPTRGQLLRINPVGFAASSTTAFSSNVQGTQPIYEDYTRSGGLFPIQ